MPSFRTKTPIEPGCYYHIYNRGNNFETTFFREEDYLFFIEKLKTYLTEFCSVYAYALLPNHYHLLIRVNDDCSGVQFYRQFARMIISYTIYLNFRESRSGNLFLRPFRRVRIENEDYLKYLVYYINTNPVKHKMGDFRQYEYSSYKSHISGMPTRIKREEVLAWFGDRKAFIEFHKYLHEEGMIRRYLLENDLEG